MEHLKKLAQDQGEDADVIADIKMQGKTKPMDLGFFPGVCGAPRGDVCSCGNDGRTLRPTTPLGYKICGLGRRPDQYDGEYLGAI